VDFRTRSTKVSARRALPFVLYCYVIAVTWKGTKCFGNTCEEYPLDNTISFAFIIFLVATKKNGAHRLVYFLSLSFSGDNFFLKVGPVHAQIQKKRPHNLCWKNKTFSM